MGALRRCESLVWLATRRAPRLASHPNPATKCPSYFLTDPKWSKRMCLAQAWRPNRSVVVVVFALVTNRARLHLLAHNFEKYDTACGPEWHHKFPQVPVAQFGFATRQGGPGQNFLSCADRVQSSLRRQTIGCFARQFPLDRTGLQAAQIVSCLICQCVRVDRGQLLARTAARSYASSRRLCRSAEPRRRCAPRRTASIARSQPHRDQ